MGRRARISAQLLDANAEAFGDSLQKAVQHAAHVRDGDADGWDDAGLLREAVGTQRGDVLENLFQMAGRRSE